MVKTSQDGDLSYGHMGGMRPRTWSSGDRAVSNDTYCVAYNLSGVWRITFQPAVFDSGSVATFLPDSPDAPHHNALHVATPVETLPIKNVTSHVDSRQTAHHDM